ncbi:MAG: hypothetical protein NW200_11770, partial [Hyphomonadaceae bacterium]|nr:hypothetical protein [Hyphomonadaceae bacterium]
ADARAEGARRPCADPVLTRAADGARAGFAGWARLASMRFAGGERAWLARRTQDADRFYLRQDLPGQAIFGIRETGAGAALSLRMPLSPGAAAPAGARLYFRDRARAPRSAADLPGRTATGLHTLAASRASATVVFAQDRRIETVERARFAALTFPDAALDALAALDPREAVEIEIDAPGGARRLYLEVGDLAAARAFLRAQPGA